MKRAFFVCLIFALVCMTGCVVSSSVEEGEPPQIVCGEGRNIIVSSEEFRFSPRISGDIEPLARGECFFNSPHGGELVLENFGLRAQFSNGEVLNLPEEMKEEGFTFYYRR